MTRLFARMSAALPWLLLAWFPAALGNAAPLSAAPGDDEALYAAAKKEGKVVVYSVLSTKAAQPLIDDFQARYPGVAVEYDGEKGSVEMDERFRSEVRSKQPTADVLWSSAMDLQMRLVRDGFAATYRSPHAAKLPRWANYKHKAYGTTLEPVVFVYNRHKVKGADIPRDHDSLARLVSHQPDVYSGKIATFDIDKSGVGFMFAAQDRKNYPKLPQFLASLGCADVQLSAGTGTMLTKISEGSYLLGYNMMGAYALSRSRKDLPGLGVVFPQDYTLVLSRVALVSRASAHPNAARLWLNHLLSARGQAVLGNSVELFPVRTDVDAAYTAAKLSTEIGAGMRPIPLTVALARDLSPRRRDVLLGFWRSSLAHGQGARSGCAAN